MEAFEALTRDYFERADPRRRLAGVLHLVDARHPGLPQDAAAFEWLIRTGLPAAIVATKVDKLSRADQQKAVRQLEERYGVAVLPESATTRAGLDAIWSLLRDWTA